jgi:hypothetical protein
MKAAEDIARALAIKLLRPDTNSALPEAQQLYRSTGWNEIDRFNDDPYPAPSLRSASECRSPSGEADFGQFCRWARMPGRPPP